jgi:hypothetical protein
MLTVNSVKNQPLIGGWQETVLQSVVENDSGTFLNGVHLSVPVARRQSHHLYVSDKRDVKTVQNEIAESLVEFLHQRFSVDDALLAILIPFIHYDQRDVDLRAVHRVIGCDLDLAAMALEYADLTTSKSLTCLKLPELVQRLASSAEDYPNMLTVMARILAAKPRSADVERCISATNLLKTSLLASSTILTQNAYLFIHHNLPPTAYVAVGGKLLTQLIRACDSLLKRLTYGALPAV